MIPRQARGEATRQSIIEAAVELFGDIGYGETGMIDVVEHAGTTKGTCYYYFPTKESLAAAIIEQANLKIAGGMSPIWESDAPPMHKLIRATFAFIALTETDETVRIGYQLRQAMRQVSPAGPRSYGDTEVVFASAIRRAMADGHVKKSVNDKEAACTLFAALAGCRLLSDALGDNPFDRLEQSWRTLLEAIATEDALSGLKRLVRSTSKSCQQTP